MNTEILKNEIRRIHPQFNEEILNEGLSFFKTESFKAKDLILKKGDVGEFLYLAESSISRCYHLDDNLDEKTIWMEPEKMFITDFESFINGSPSKYNLQFYQDTTVWIISRKDLISLYENHKDWAFFGLKLMENYHVRILDLFTIMFQNNASENYHFIESHYSEFLKTAPLKDVASMLNLSPVSVSRIRAGKQTKK